MKCALYSSGLLRAGSSIVGALSTALYTNRFAGLSPDSTALSTWKLQATIIKHIANSFIAIDNWICFEPSGLAARCDSVKFFLETLTSPP